VKSAWLNLRASRYFIGPYSDTPAFTILGPPPYYVLSEGCSPEELGRTIRLALEASTEEGTSGRENARLADERTSALARLARVKDGATFERGARLVNFDVRASGEILVTPSLGSVDIGSPLQGPNGFVSLAPQTLISAMRQ
jgi:hypothetical protein